MILTREDFNIIQPSSKGGDSKPGNGKPTPGTEQWNIDGDDDEAGEKEPQQKPKSGGEGGEGEEDGNNGEPYKGDENAGKDIKVRKIGYGSIGDVADYGDLDEIAKLAEEDQINKDGPTVSFPGKEKGGDDIETVWKEKTARAFDRASGTGSGGVDRLIRDMLRTKVDWKTELKRFVAKIFSSEEYRIPNRRFVGQDIYTWGIKAKVEAYKDVVIAIDTSGSIKEADINKFGTEIKSLASKNKIKNLFIVYCDAAVTAVENYQSSTNFTIEKMKPKGGGGTSFYPVFEWISENVPKPAFVIYFTDSYGDCPPVTDKIVSSYKNRVLWVINEVGDPKQGNNITFGKKIMVNDKDMKE